MKVIKLCIDRTLYFYLQNLNTWRVLKNLITYAAISETTGDALARPGIDPLFYMASFLREIFGLLLDMTFSIVHVFH